jgi:hypothetical protein
MHISSCMFTHIYFQGRMFKRRVIYLKCKNPQSIHSWASLKNCKRQWTSPSTTLLGKFILNISIYRSNGKYSSSWISIEYHFSMWDLNLCSIGWWIRRLLVLINLKIGWRRFKPGRTSELWELRQGHRLCDLALIFQHRDISLGTILKFIYVNKWDVRFSQQKFWLWSSEWCHHVVPQLVIDHPEESVPSSEVFILNLSMFNIFSAYHIADTKQ